MNSSRFRQVSCVSNITKDQDKDKDLSLKDTHQDNDFDES